MPLAEMMGPWLCVAATAAVMVLGAVLFIPINTKLDDWYERRQGPKQAESGRCGSGAGWHVGDRGPGVA